MRRVLDYLLRVAESSLSERVHLATQAQAAAHGHSKFIVRQRRRVGDLGENVAEVFGAATFGARLHVVAEISWRQQTLQGFLTQTYIIENLMVVVE